MIFTTTRNQDKICSVCRVNLARRNQTKTCSVWRETGSKIIIRQLYILPGIKPRCMQRSGFFRILCCVQFLQTRLSFYDVSVKYLQQQYAFIHDAVVDHINCGANEVEATQVMIEIKNLSKKNKKGETGFEEKFMVSQYVM